MGSAGIAEVGYRPEVSAAISGKSLTLAAHELRA